VIGAYLHRAIVQLDDKIVMLREWAFCMPASAFARTRRWNITEL
jgi:hypothetical protein